MGRASGGLLILVKYNNNIKLNLLENDYMWIIVEIIYNDSNFKIDCAYIGPNLNHDECINLLQDALNHISDSYQNYKIIFVGDFNAHIWHLNLVEEKFFHTDHISEQREALNNVTKRFTALVTNSYQQPTMVYWVALLGTVARIAGSNQRPGK